MTTIAYRDGVLSADSAFFRGATRFLGSAAKVARTSDGVLVAHAGCAGFGCEFNRWVLGGEVGQKPEPKSDADGCDVGLIFRKDGSIEMHEPGGMVLLHDQPYFAVGSGRDQALGAMFAGADPETAVRAAIAHDAWSGGEVVTVRR